MATQVGKSYVSNVTDGSGYSPRRFGFLSIQAIPVCVASGIEGANGAYMLLGEAQGRLVFYRLDLPQHRDSIQYVAGIVRVVSTGVAIKHMNGWNGSDAEVAQKLRECDEFVRTFKPSAGSPSTLK
jgi:hypothetical protein